MPETFRYTLIIEGIDLESDEPLDKLAGLEFDATLARQGGVTTASITIESASGAWPALCGGVAGLESICPTLRVIRLDPDLVSIADIADRLDRTRESIRLTVNGDRGVGGFPPPVGTVGEATRVWEWAAVNDWFRTNVGIGDEESLIDHEMATLFNAQLLTRYVTHPPATSTEKVPARSAWSGGWTVVHVGEARDVEIVGGMQSQVSAWLRHVSFTQHSESERSGLTEKVESRRIPPYVPNG